MTACPVISSSLISDITTSCRRWHLDVAQGRLLLLRWLLVAVAGHVRDAEEVAHLLERAASRLWEVGEEEDPGERGDARVEEEAAPDGDALGQRQEGHGDDPAGDAVHADAERAAERAQVKREDLGAVHPRDGAEPDGEEGHHPEDGGDADADGPGDGGALRVVADDGEPEPEADEADDHAPRARQQEWPTAEAVQRERGHQDEDRLGHADGARGAQQLVLVGDAGALEHARAVEHHRVDARRLLEEVDSDRRQEHAPDGRRRGQDQLFPHALLAAGPFGHGDDVAVEVGGDAGRLLDVREAHGGLLGRVGGLAEHDFRVGETALHDEPPRGLRHAEHHEREDDGRRGADAEHEAPADLEAKVGEGVVGDVAEQDADVDEHLGEGGEEPAWRRRRDLGRVDGRDHERVADADARHEPASHEHGVVHREAHHEGPDEEDDGGEDDGEPASDPVGGAPCREGAQERVEVEDAEQDLHLHVWDLEVLLDEQRRAAHHPDV